MKKVIHHIRNIRSKSEEDRRHILHITIVIAGIIMVLLWTFSLGRTITNPDTKTKIKQDLKPFSALQKDVVGSFNGINGKTPSSSNQ